MRYQVEVGDKADAQLAKLDAVVGASVERKIQWLAENATDMVHRRLVGMPDDLTRAAAGSSPASPCYVLNSQMRKILAPYDNQGPLRVDSAALALSAAGLLREVQEAMVNQSSRARAQRRAV